MHTFENIGLGIVLVVVILILIAVLTAIVILVKLLSSIRRISVKAENVTENFADIAAMVGKKVAPVALSAAVAAAMRRFKSNKS